MKDIYILDNDETIFNDLTSEFKKDHGIKLKRFAQSEFKVILKHIPDILLINEDCLTCDIIDLAKVIRSDENNSITPIIVISSNTDVNHEIKILNNDIELYFKKPYNKEVIYLSIRNIMRLLNSNRTVSPLTGLPGNVQITAEMKRRIQNNIKFAMLYVDLDNFKAYNDTYGFSKGDEIIKFTAKVLTDNILNIKGGDNNFVGHIGGDDFVGIVEGENFEEVCQNIIIEFDNKVKHYFDEKDLLNGFLEVENRKGTIEEFPLTTVSIGAVEVKEGKFKNPLEIGEAGASVKHLAKTIRGSTYVIN
ncbi:MAG: diguanylate cyclase, partial [Clostridiales bacterium]|nr:diguanylate cyclase [Clostridiales bacterium]